MPIPRFPKQFVRGSIIGGVLSSGTVTITSCSSTHDMVHVVPTGAVETKTVPLEQWDKLHLSSSSTTEVILGPGFEPKVEIRADVAVLPYLGATITEGTLEFPFTRNLHIVGNSEYFTPKFRVFTPGPIAKVTNSGSGSLKIQGLQQVSLDLKMSGSGLMALEGAVTHLDLHISGSGMFDGKNLQVNQTVLRLSGSGDITLQTRVLQGKASGSGNISIPKETLSSLKVSGSAIITRR